MIPDEGMFSGLSATYAVAGTMLLAAMALGLVALFAGGRASRSRGAPDAAPAPEFGGRTAHKTWVQFRVRYLMVALLFGVFDMEMVYMFPWAVVFKRVGMVAFLDMFVFIMILAAALAFAWKEGAFDWEG